MEDPRFDAFVRLVGASASRRQVIRLLAGAVVGAIAGIGPRARRGWAATATPLPNFPFLVAQPTDPGLTDFALDFAHGGGPILSADPSAISTLSPALSGVLAPDFRAAYNAALDRASPDNANTVEGAVSTFLVDLGSAAGAKAVLADYVRTVRKASGATDLGKSPRFGQQTIYVGCNGGCLTDLVDPYASVNPAANSIIVVGRQDRFLYDIRVRDLTGGQVGVTDGQSVAELVDAKLAAVAGAEAAAAEGGVRALLQPTPDDLANFLTLPVFSLAGEAPEQDANLVSYFQHGMAIPLAFETADQRAERQQKVTGLGITDQLQLFQFFKTATPYQPNYELQLVIGQNFYANAADRDKRLDTFFDDVAQQLPNDTVTDAGSTDTYKRFVAMTPLGRNNVQARFETYVSVDSFVGPASINVDVVAFPLQADTPPIPANMVAADLGPLVDEVVDKILGYLTKPGTAPAAVTLQNNPTRPSSGGATTGGTTGQASGCIPNCDCDHVQAGLLTDSYQRQCRDVEQQLKQRQADGTFRITTRADGTISGGDVCDSVASGEHAWPLMDGPAECGGSTGQASGPTGPVNTAGLLLYPTDYAGLPAGAGILGGTYFPAPAPLVTFVPGLSEPVPELDALFLAVGTTTSTGEVDQWYGQSGSWWAPKADDAAAAFAAVTAALTPLATQSFPLADPLAGRPAWAGFLPNFSFAPGLPAGDLSLGCAQAGSAILFAALPGNTPDQITANLLKIVNRAIAKKIPGANLGLQLPYWTGPTANTRVSRYYTLLDGLDIPAAALTADQQATIAQRNSNQISVLHQVQGFTAGDGQQFSTSWDLRRFHKSADAANWMTAYPDGIARDFGVPLQPITEGANLDGSNGSSFFIFQRQQESGALEAAILGTARVGSTVAVIRIGAVAEPSATSVIDWFTRDGWQQAAAGGVDLMTRQIALIRAKTNGYEKPGWALAVPDSLAYTP